MTKFNVGETIAEGNKMGAGSGRAEFFDFKEGSNKVRILTVFTPYASHYKAGACLGKDDCPICKSNEKETDDKKKNFPSVKYVCYVLEYPTLQIKLAQLPWKVAKGIQDLQADPDYTFDEAPMPYDIKINATGAGTKEVQYSVIASPKREPVPVEILETLSKMSDPAGFKTAMQNKRRKDLGMTVEKNDLMKPHDNYPTEQISPEDIPF